MVENWERQKRVMPRFAAHETVDLYNLRAREVRERLQVDNELAPACQ